MEYSWALPGVKVECIVENSEWNPVGIHYSVKAIPHKGRIYTIRSVGFVEGSADVKVGLELEEHHNHVYDIKGFRPLVKKDQETFRQLLQNLPTERSTELEKA